MDVPEYVCSHCEEVFIAVNDAKKMGASERRWRAVGYIGSGLCRPCHQIAYRNRGLEPQHDTYLEAWLRERRRRLGVA